MKTEKMWIVWTLALTMAAGLFWVPMALEGQNIPQLEQFRLFIDGGQCYTVIPVARWWGDPLMMLMMVPVFFGIIQLLEVRKLNFCLLAAATVFGIGLSWGWMDRMMADTLLVIVLASLLTLKFGSEQTMAAVLVLCIPLLVKGSVVSVLFVGVIIFCSLMISLVVEAVVEVMKIALKKQPKKPSRLYRQVRVCEVCENL